MTILYEFEVYANTYIVTNIFYYFGSIAITTTFPL